MKHSSMEGGLELTENREEKKTASKCSDRLNAEMMENNAVFLVIERVLYYFYFMYFRAQVPLMTHVPLFLDVLELGSHCCMFSTTLVPLIELQPVVSI